VKVDAYINPRMAHHRARVDLFVEGMVAAGDDPVVRLLEGDSPAGNDGDFALFWSGRFPKACAAYDHYLLMEGGRWLAGGVGKSVSVGWNGFGGGAEFCADENDTSRRELFPFAPEAWRDNDQGYALLFGQVQRDFGAEDTNLAALFDAAAAFYRDAGIKVMYRPHPADASGYAPKNVKVSTGKLEKALAGARLAVSWTSTAGVDAVLAGVPSVALGQNSPARAVSADVLTLEPPTPDREPWLNWLTQTEWTYDEIAAGVAWAQLRKGLGRR
jgi:hypothetical protein